LATPLEKSDELFASGGTDGARESPVESAPEASLGTRTIDILVLRPPARLRAGTLLINQVGGDAVGVCSGLVVPGSPCLIGITVRAEVRKPAADVRVEHRVGGVHRAVTCGGG